MSQLLRYACSKNKRRKMFFRGLYVFIICFTSMGREKYNLLGDVPDKIVSNKLRK